jgi:glyoxylase-like metal-dependent hydrolase (beta-lactamase superfamily II)
MQKFLGLILFLSLCVPVASAHGDDSHFENRQDVTVKTTKVSGNIYLLQGRGGNVGALVGSEGILIVDDDYKAVSEKLRDALKALGSEKPRFIFNTHWHGDHTEGNEFFGRDSIIVAHKNVRQRLSQVNSVFGMKTQPYPEFALPMITYTESISIHFAGEEVRAVYYPNGHTDGDTVVFFVKTNVVHLGDDFFVNNFTLVDIENGGRVQGLINNIAALLKQIPADAKLIPGHGGISTIDDLKNYNTMLIETAAVVQKAMKENKSLDDIKKEGMSAKYESWGKNFIKTDFWIETIYKSYAKK